jgi:hypothetical protein
MAFMHGYADALTGALTAVQRLFAPHICWVIMALNGSLSVGSSACNLGLGEHFVAWTCSWLVCLFSLKMDNREGRGYYAFSPHELWRFVVLDSYDESVIGWPHHSEQHKGSVVRLQQHNTNTREVRITTWLPQPPSEVPQQAQA